MDTTQTPTSLDRPLATGKPWLICGISRAQWFRLCYDGRTPLPSARLGTRRPVYLIDELEAWLRAGAPCRDEWVRMKKGLGMGENQSEPTNTIIAACDDQTERLHS